MVTVKAYQRHRRDNKYPDLYVGAQSFSDIRKALHHAAKSTAKLSYRCEVFLQGRCRFITWKSRAKNNILIDCKENKKYPLQKAVDIIMN